MLFVGVCVALTLALASHRALQPFFSRVCQGFRWHRAFPEANTSDIRSFLTTFGESFSFSQRHVLKFAPTDNIMQIYYARNQGGSVDALELESFALALKRNYNFSLQSALHPNLTLGELFASLRRVAP